MVNFEINHFANSLLLPKIKLRNVFSCQQTLQKWETSFLTGGLKKNGFKNFSSQALAVLKIFIASAEQINIVFQNHFGFFKNYKHSNPDYLLVIGILKVGFFQIVRNWFRYAEKFENNL